MKKSFICILCIILLLFAGCNKSAEDTTLAYSGDQDTPYGFNPDVPAQKNDAENASSGSSGSALQPSSQPAPEPEAVVEEVEEEPFDIENFDINDIDPYKVMPHGTLTGKEGSTKYCAVAPLPFTKMYESPDENSLITNFCDSIYPAKTCRLAPGNNDFYYIEYGDNAGRGYEIKGYVRADQVITDCNYAYNIQELDLVDEKGNPVGGKLANHSLVVWKQNVDGVSEIYTFEDGTIRKAYVPAGSLADLTSSSCVLFKYNQIKEARKIEDPLLYNLMCESIIWRCNISSTTSDLFLRKELAAFREFRDEKYRPMEYNSDIYSILKTPYDADAVKKLEDYAGDRKISWGIFPEPSLRVSSCNGMSFICDSVIPQGTIVARINGSHLYYYVDPVTGEVMQTEVWCPNLKPEIRNDFKDDMKMLSDIYAGRVSDEEAREFFCSVFDKDMKYPKYDDPNFTRHIEKYKDENFGTDFSDGISDILSFPGKAVVKAEGDGATAYSRPGTIGLVTGTVANGTELVPTKLATNWYSWGEDGWFNVMFFYVETGAVSGWIRACDCVASDTFKYTHGGSVQNEWEREDYVKKDEPMGPENATPDSGGSARFPVAREISSGKKFVPEVTEIVPYGGTVMAYYEEPCEFNPKFCYVIADSPWSEPIVGYADELLTEPAVEIPDLTPLLVQAICIEKRYGYRDEYSIGLYSVEVIYEEKSYWLPTYSYFCKEEAYLPYEK